ncbi:MAG: RuBisCO large subunit C-terminal-like domain-containing protein [Balneolaceae bacterium]
MTIGDSFSITYTFSANGQDEAMLIARNISLEQTAELPEDAIPDSLKSYTGRVSPLQEMENGTWNCTITYPCEVAGGEITQFINVLFGNISLKPGIRITSVNPGKLLPLFPGPKMGLEGIRKRMGATKRPLSCTALKPMGATSNYLANTAYLFSAGGIDIIKDDHGLANQPMSVFKDRVEKCVRAVQKGSRESGKRSLYVPNITADSSTLMKRAEFAFENGADGFLIAPQITGLAELARVSAAFPNVPVIAHPAFSGPYTINRNSGFTPEFYYGYFWKALGADAVIYPNAGGRFSFSTDTCLEINRMCRTDHPGIGRAFPVPGGGISRDTIPALVKSYGNDTIFLIGGSLYQHPEGLLEAAKEFRDYLVTAG